MVPCAEPNLKLVFILRLNSHLLFFRRELFFCIVITVVWTIAGVNVPTRSNATHYYVNSSRNSSRLKNRKCELTLIH